MMPEIKNIIFLLVLAIMVQSSGLNYQMQSDTFNFIENCEEIKQSEFNPIISDIAISFFSLDTSILFYQRSFFTIDDDLKIVMHQEVLVPPPKA